MNTSKIDTVSRMVSASMFGLVSKKIGKQWHCNKCKSDLNRSVRIADASGRINPHLKQFLPNQNQVF